MIGILGLHGSASHPASISEFAARLARGRPCCTPRGTFADGEGFTFFRRRPDFSIPAGELIDLARQSLSPDGVAACGLSDMLLVGYSSGAIFSTALLSAAPDSFVGGVLLRPQPISDEFSFPDLSGKPILIISAAHDARRKPWHATRLAEQLVAANALVTHHTLDAGHEWAPDDLDFVLARLWMDEHFPA